tara:strand:- start:619 stop:1614 length:996 start_codon:yes stop_codon:yes gene_type:complete
MKFPNTRMRRTRKHEWSRLLTGENQISVNDLIWPVFIQEAPTTKVESMPGVKRYDIDDLLAAITDAVELGIKSVAIFPCVDSRNKDANGTMALDKDNFLYQAIKLVKAKFPSLGLIADVALDPYTDHGHDGVLDDEGYVDNDRTIEILSQLAINLAEAGVDVVAPSDMQDGRIEIIRGALELEGYKDCIILSYTAKYASSFYGPFRDAVGSSNAIKNKSKAHYQMDFSNSEEAILEAQLDISEGADWLMVKPAMPYLDIIAKMTDRFSHPIFAYQVSGEYAMLMDLSSRLQISPEVLFYESLMGLKRAGACAFLTYAAPMMAAYLKRHTCK